MYQRVPDSLLDASAAELDGLPLRLLESTIPEGIPRDLQGHVFVVGPVGSVESGGLPSPLGVPVFNGNGMIYRFDFDVPGEVRVASKLARTPCYYADLATHRDPRFAHLRFRDHGLLRFSTPLGLRNELNTAFLPIVAPGRKPRLLVTYDAGRPFEIDTKTLDLITPVGSNDEWEPAIPTLHPFGMVLATAHPYYDPQRDEMIGLNFGRSVLNLLLGSAPLLDEPRRLPGALDRVLHAAASLLERTPVRRPAQRAERAARRALGRLRGALAHAPSASLGKLAAELPGLGGLPGVPDRGNDFVRLIRWNTRGRFDTYRLFLPDGRPVRIEQSMHQLGVTRNYVVLMDTAFKIGVESVFNDPIAHNPGLDRLRRALDTRPQCPYTVIYLVRRSDLRPGGGKVTVTPATLPLETVHFLTDYDDTGDRIVLHCAHNTSADVSEWIRSFDELPAGGPSPARLRGMLALGQADVNRLGRYTIEGSTGRLLDHHHFKDPERALGIGLFAARDFTPSGLLPERFENVYWQGWGVWPELSTAFVDSLYADHPHRGMPLRALRAIRDGGGKPAGVFRFNHGSMSIEDRYEFPRKEIGDWLGSQQFVPRRGGSGSDMDGYLVSGVSTERGSEIWIFDAANLAKGPICKLGHPELRYGMTIHAAWLPTIARRDVDYRITAYEDHETLVSVSPFSGVRELFEEEVYPRFDV